MEEGGEGATKNSLTTADSIPGSTESDNTPLTSSATTENDNESQCHGQHLIKRITHNGIPKFSLFSSGGCGIVMAYSYVYRLSKVEGCPWCRVVKMINIGVDAENTSGHVSGCVEKTQRYNTHAHLICLNCDAQIHQTAEIE